MMIGRFAAILLLALLAGCSSFPSEFKRATVNSAREDSVEGAWQGNWKSDGGHSGALRCVLTKVNVDAKDDQAASRPSAAAMVAYDASFEAKFFGIFTAHYRVLLTGWPQEKETVLKGDHNLGWLAGGVYHYEAQVTSEKFDATYRSKADEGVFRMERVKHGGMEGTEKMRNHR